MCANVFFEHEDLKSILSADDPDCLFTDLEQIGHGNFGAVYFAKDARDGCSVAIKKISCDKKQKITDIVVELKVMKRVNHKNTVSLKEVFAKGLTVWLVMEYCVGSLTDIITALKKPFAEPEIASISRSVLNGLDFLHSLNWIHRDIKAANILITSQALVKIADFGSTSLKDPANTFVGSPYWMAPEVIMAMEDGLYDKMCDIWSFGITIIEIAESKPPLFDMNSMSALYYIAQNEPPSFANSQLFSKEFVDFVTSCLRKEPKDRKTTQQLLESDFFSAYANTEDSLQEIIYECFNKVAVENSVNYEKVKSFIRHCDTDTLSDVSNSNNSVTSHSNESTKKGYHRKNNFAKSNTIKMNATIVHESLFHENQSYKENMEEYRILRGSLVKQLNALDAKLNLLRTETSRYLEKELESFALSLEKAVEKVRQKHEVEYEQLLKNQVLAEKKLLKSLNISKSKQKTNIELTSNTDLFNLRQEQLIERLIFTQRAEIDTVIYFTKEKKQYYGKKMQNTKNINNLILDHYGQITKKKLAHLEQVQALELTNINQYGRKQMVQLRRKHIAELRQKPKTLKQIESTLKKMKTDQVKTQSAQFKKLIEDAQQKYSKEEASKIKEQMKKERIKKLTKLEEEYNELFAKRTLDLELKLETDQINEAEQLSKKVDLDREQLQAYQSLMKKNLTDKNEKSCNNLTQEVAEKEQQVAEYVQAKVEELDEELLSKQLQLDDHLASVRTEMKADQKLFEQNSLDKFPVAASEVLARTGRSSFFYKLF